ncbi:MAG: adenosine deaminase [Gammaproteobacteria bacterium]
MSEQLTSLPKAELHVHLEGTASPQLVKRLALRNKIAIPERLFDHDDHFAWNDFMAFLKAYDDASSAIRTPQDYRDVTFEYLAQCAQQGVIYTELASSPDHAALSGMSYTDHLEGVVQGIEDAKAQYGIEARIIIILVRHFGVDSANKAVAAALKNPHHLVVGIGLGGDEVNFPPKQFKRVYAMAAEAGLGLTAHAGEWDGPERITEALDELHITRLGHGVRIVEDDNLIRRVVAENITLECCPTSNIELQVYPSYAHHPFKKLLEANVPLTLNSDDPPYFKTTVGKEYQVAQEHFGLDEAGLLAITRTAINASFADPATKQQLLTKVNDYRKM